MYFVYDFMINKLINTNHMSKSAVKDISEVTAVLPITSTVMLFLDNFSRPQTE